MPRFHGPPGFVVKVQGRRPIEEVRAKLNASLDFLEAQGVDELSGINVYLHPYAEGTHVEIVGKDGDPIEGLTYFAPVKRVQAKAPAPKPGKAAPLRLAIDNATAD